MIHCCLCGLLCSLDRAATDACPRRNQWLQQLSAHTAQLSAHTAQQASQRAAQADSHGPLAPAQLSVASQSFNPAQLAAEVETIAAHFYPPGRSLIWIDAADVHTLRCAVALAATARATIHVAQSTGAIASHRVLTSQGWLGSSLAEVASHADLIISLGGGLRTEAPLLAQRFFYPALASGRAQWCHIDSHASTINTLPLQSATPQSATSQSATSQTCDEPSPNWTAVWPRAQWYEQLTHIMLGLQNQNPSTGSYAQSGAENGNERMPETTGALLDKLRAAKNIVWLWDVDEFRDAIDELCINRLLGISRLLSQTARCGLIALDAQVGRVTAAETLLWLTGCSGTAQFDGQHWHQPYDLDELSLEDWPREFDSIVAVRSLPSVYPLPSLQASHFIVPELSLLPDHVVDEQITRVASVGVDSDGHVMRGDRGTMLFCRANDAVSRPSPRPASMSLLTSLQQPTAGELLEQVMRRVQSKRKADAN